MDGHSDRKNPPHPQASANWLSKLTFSWLIPIFYRGLRKEMEMKDLFEPLPAYESGQLGDRFEREWEKEVAHAMSKGTKPKLLKVICRIFLWTNLMYGLIFFMLEIILRVLQPFFIGLLVRHFNVDNAKLPEPGPEDPTYMFRVIEIFNPPRTKISQKEAMFYALAIAVDSLLNVLIRHPYMMSIMQQGMQCRVGACSLIYRKALRLSQRTLRETTVGHIVNLLSNDVNRFDIAIVNLRDLWVAPLETIIVTIFLYYVVGWATFLGLAFIVALIPFQVYLGKKSSFYRLRTATRTDERVRLMSEIINGIQGIKMFAWEKPFTKIVEWARMNEISELKGSSTIKGILFSFYIFTSRFSIFLTIIAYSVNGGVITADMIFLITAFYNLIKNSVAIFFASSLSVIAEALVSVERIEKFLLCEEIAKPIKIPRISEKRKKLKPSPPLVYFEKAEFKWLADHVGPDLSNVSVIVPPTGLLAIIGPVGAGKSTLFQAILREVPQTSGRMDVMGTISYAPQEPWLFAGSVRQNILFGLPYNRQRYKRVIDACALKRDFELLPFGDRTIVGDRGASLSGGQRARISLARAVYKEADIYLLDDPLSAVDTHVGKHLFEDCISGFLKNKTVILVTHQLQYLTHCDHIIILNNGSVEDEGSFDQLQSSGVNFAKLFQPNLDGGDYKENTDTVHSRRGSISSTTSRVTEKGDDAPRIMEETSVVGGLGCMVYVAYAKSARNIPLVLAVIFLFFLSQVLSSLNDWWCSKWSAQEEYIRGLNITEEERISAKYKNIYIYAALNVATVVIPLARSHLFFMLCCLMSCNLHDSMFRRVTSAPMKFFFDIPSGRILNRFSKDMGAIDEMLPQSMIDCFQIFLSLLGIVILCAVVSPVLIIPTLVISVVFYMLRIVYVRTSRNIKRLEATTRSPVFSHLNASLQGLTTIRAFEAQDILRQEFDRHQNLHSTSWYIFIASSRAFGFWLDSICVVYIAIVCFTVLYLGHSGADAGLAITQSIGLTGMFQWGMRQSAELENQMTSVERVLEYTNCTQEAQLESKPETKPPPSWPTKGAITVQNVVLRYDPNGETILHNVSFSINPQEKIGIVGRTGAGKSTLISAMFRLAYIDGVIVVDSVDTSTIGLHDLRSKISIIPQEPVLFSGTLRRNLDPFDEYPDWCLWNALEEVELKDVVSESPEGLHGKMSEGGSNFSVGQRQLICLARAIVRNNRILILDEATANVDPQTDLLIQRTIRRKFTDCTVLTIAHRLHTVMDSDRILVMDAGSVAEFDHPYTLLKDSTSMLTGLVEQTGRSTARELTSIAKKNYKLKLRKEDPFGMENVARDDIFSQSDSSRSSSPDQTAANADELWSNLI